MVFNQLKKKLKVKNCFQFSIKLAKFKTGLEQMCLDDLLAATALVIDDGDHRLCTAISSDHWISGI